MDREHKNDGCTLVRSQMESECSNLPHFPEQTIEALVVLAQPTIQVCVEADIELAEPALEIKRSKKDVLLTQCKLLPSLKVNATMYRHKLFLSGYIRKNIEYATVNKVTTSAICGQMHHATAHIPFHCCTTLDFTSPLLLMGERNATEIPIMKTDREGNFQEDRQFSEIVTYKEQPFCEIVAVQFFELDFAPHHQIQKTKELPNEHTFKTIREKIVMELTVKVLQKQQVQLSSEMKVVHDKEKIADQPIIVTEETMLNRLVQKKEEQIANENMQEQQDVELPDYSEEKKTLLDEEEKMDLS